MPEFQGTLINPAVLHIVNDPNELPYGDYCTGGPSARFGGLSTTNVQPLVVYMKGPNNPNRKDFDKLVLKHCQKIVADFQVSSAAAENLTTPSLGVIQFERYGPCCHNDLGKEADYTITLSITELRFKGGPVPENGNLLPGDRYEVVIFHHLKKAIPGLSCCTIS